MRKKWLLFTSVALLILIASCGTEKGKQSTPKDGEGTDYQVIIKPNNQLAFELMSEVQPDENGNLFLSPTSLFMALSMVYNGAESETKEEMARALQLENMAIEKLNKANAAFINYLQRDSNSIELKIANSIWLNEDFHFQKDFAEPTKKYFDAEIEEINVHDPASADKINNWVSKATNGKIEEMVSAPLNPDLVTYLLNAIYFNGEWTYAFDEQETQTKPFHLSGGGTKDVSMMALTEKFRYMRNDLFQAVELPYGDNEMNMKIFLPRENTAIEDFYKTLTEENWSQWNDQLETKKGTVNLPKFQLDYEVELNSVLKKLGMHKAFEKDANFSKMIEEDNPIWISSVKQKTFIDVHEKGTEAAAVTGIEMETTSARVDEPFHMTMDRPFFIAITDEETGAILFMGTVANPVE